jgi:2-dehydropantoate 2-reductase
MRITVMGAGAVGGYFGARLAAGGHDVQFIARGDHLDALSRIGLRIRSPAGDLHIKNARFSAAAALDDSADLILFCVKSYDTEAAAEAVRPAVGASTAILSLQNGVDNPEKLAGRFGAERTLAGVVYLGAQVIAPGVIAHSAGGKIVFGPSRHGECEAATLVEQVLQGAEIPCERSAEIQVAQWQKLLWNAPFCAISCLARATVDEIVATDSLTELALDCMAEVRDAAATRNIPLETRLFSETLSFSKTLGAFKPSMLQDLEGGKPLEYEAFNGIIVKVLSSAGKDAPVNRVFYNALSYLDEKIRKEASRLGRGNT